MNTPAKCLPTLLPTKHDWKAQSSTSYRRSAGLEAIDKAVEACHQVAASDYAARIGLSDQLLEKIKNWKATKLVGGQFKSARLTAVETLTNKTKAERQQLEDAIAQAKQQRLADAQKLLLAQEKFADLRPQEVAIYSAGVLINNDGNFIESSKILYNSKKSDLGEQADELTIRLALLKDKLDSAYAHFEQQPNLNDQMLGLFTVPEWFFKRPGNLFSEEDKLRIQAACQEFSAARPGMLLVPGSTVWTKESFDGPELHASASVFFNGEMIHETHKAQMLGDEDGYLQQEGYTKEQMRSKWQKVWNKTQQTAQDSCFFKLGDRLIALEICGDHGRANQEYQNSSTPSEGSDIHILVSKGMGFRTPCVNLREGGIGVSNDASISFADDGKVEAYGIRTVISGKGLTQVVNPNSHTRWKQNTTPDKKERYTQADELTSSHLGIHKLPARH